MKSDSNILYGRVQPELIRTECLADLLEATIQAFPEKIALSSDHEQISYAELGARADLVAHYLINAGVKPGDILGLWLPRDRVIGDASWNREERCCLVAI
nr:AMP-binding protein [uncultured Undibacterium sp.]